MIVKRTEDAATPKARYERLRKTVSFYRTPWGAVERNERVKLIENVMKGDVEGEQKHHACTLGI